MPSFMPCQICARDDWTVLAERVFSVNDIDTEDDINRRIFTFIFEDWFPGRTELCFQNICCNHCGFMSLSPRPTEEDISLLRRSEPTCQTGFSPYTDVAVSQRRSRILYDSIGSIADLDKISTVLDFGGMDGNLMQSFIAGGKRCYLIDFCPYCIPNVRKVGNTLEALKEEDRFDLILCSHVIEHVVSPVEILRGLAGHLTREGILFAEVPMEVWKRPPLLKQSNPVSHLNFFTPNSLSNMFRAGGLSVERCHLAEYLHTNREWNPGIRCVGRMSDGRRAEPLLKSDAGRFLKPARMTYFHFYLRNPRRLINEFLKRFAGGWFRR